MHPQNKAKESYTSFVVVSMHIVDCRAELHWWRGAVMSRTMADPWWIAMWSRSRGLLDRGVGLYTLCMGGTLIFGKLVSDPNTTLRYFSDTFMIRLPPAWKTHMTLFLVSVLKKGLSGRLIVRLNVFGLKPSRT